MAKKEIIILHGWGLRGATYRKLVNLLSKKGYRVYAPDLPGFGSEPIVSDSMVLDDYVFFLKKYINKHKLTKPILVGHSFGGRVAIKYSWLYPDSVTKLILTGVPVIRHASLNKKVAFIVAIIGGRLIKLFPKEIQDFSRKMLYSLIGEWDYYKAGQLKQVFKNIIGEDLTQYAKDIKIPTFLVWGADDRITPVSDVKKIKIYMLHAKSFIINNVGHKLPYTNPQTFFEVIQTLL